MIALYNKDEVVNEARSWLDTPYHDQASLKGVGCDCLGLVVGVWKALYGSALPQKIPAYSRFWGEVKGDELLLRAVKNYLVERPLEAFEEPGNVVCFRMVPGADCKHLGITGYSECFIHAYEGLGVTTQRMTPFWKRRIVAVGSFPAVLIKGR